MVLTRPLLLFNKALPLLLLLLVLLLLYLKILVHLLWENSNRNRLRFGFSYLNLHPYRLAGAFAMGKLKSQPVAIWVFLSKPTSL